MEMLELAFIGDAVHTLFVREYVLAKYQVKMDKANTIASSFCNATSQSQTLKRILPALSDEEKEIVRKTRNIKNKHKAKNVDIMTYKEATCFEALIGHHYINKNNDRLSFLLESSLEGER